MGNSLLKNIQNSSIPTDKKTPKTKNRKTFTHLLKIFGHRIKNNRFSKLRIEIKNAHNKIMGGLVCLQF